MVSWGFERRGEGLRSTQRMHGHRQHARSAAYRPAVAEGTPRCAGVGGASDLTVTLAVSRGFHVLPSLEAGLSLWQAMPNPQMDEPRGHRHFVKPNTRPVVKPRPTAYRPRSAVCAVQKPTQA